MTNLKLSALAAALFLAGCASSSLPSRVSPDPAMTRMPAVAPAPSAAVRPGLSIERWWLQFDDADLDHLMKEALARNEDLEAAIARVREAQASLDVVRAAQSPSLDANASSARARKSEVLSSEHRFSLEAGYEVDLWGRLSAGSEAARQRLLATEWARRSIEWSLTARLAEAYFSLAAVERQIDLSRAMRASRETTLNLRRREHGAGMGTEFDLRRAEAELTGTDATLASLARQRASLEHALTALLGRTPMEIGSVSLPRISLDESRDLEAVLPEGSTSELLSRRPDLRQAEAELAAANASIDAARAATLPSLRLSGSLGSDARRLTDLFSGPAALWSIAASLAQPVFDGGRLQARAREEHARAEQALANYRKVVTGALLDVREAYAALDTSQQSYIAQRDRAAALARARALAQRGFENGASGYLDLLDADRNWYQAQLDQVNAYRDRLVGQVSAYKALGGGYIQTGSSL